MVRISLQDLQLKMTNWFKLSLKMLIIILSSLFQQIRGTSTSTGAICETKYISSSRCYVDYGTQLGSRYARSMIDCTQDCSTRAECRSVFYDPTTKFCRINSDTLPSIGTCPKPIKYCEFIVNSCHTPSSMGEPCLSSTECSDVSSAECRDGVCKCIVGYSYHDGTKRCVPDCGQLGYGATYQEITGAIMMGFFNYDFRPMDAAGCKALCISETRFVCRTAEAYVASNGVNGCQLSWETFYTNPEAHFASADSTTYIRDCS